VSAEGAQALQVLMESQGVLVAKKRLEDTSRYFYQSIFKYMFISLYFSKKKCE